MQSARSSSAESLGTEPASPAPEQAMVPLCGDGQAAAALPRGGAALKAAQAAEEEAVAEQLQLLPAESSQLVQRPALRSQRQRGGRPKKAAGLQKCRYLAPLAAKAWFMPCSTQYAEQTEQHAACHAAHSIMQSRQSSTVHSRAAHSMPCSTQYAEQTEQQLAACHAAHSIMQSSTQHYAEQTVSNYSNYTRRSWTGRTGWSSGRARA